MCNCALQTAKALYCGILAMFFGAGMAGKNKGRPRKIMAADAAEHSAGKNSDISEADRKVNEKDEQTAAVKNGSHKQAKAVEEKSVIEKNNNDSEGHSNTEKGGKNPKAVAGKKRGRQKDVVDNSTPVEAETETAIKSVDTEAHALDKGTLLCWFLNWT
jgi:hypothetical protein